MRLALAALVMIPLAACVEVDVRDDAPTGSSSRPAVSSSESAHAEYLYREQGAAPDAQVNPGQAFNDYRAANGLPRLARSSQLTAAAAAQARDMARMDQLTHEGANGSSVGDRARAQGYDYATVAENVAWTPRGFPTVMEVWNNSSGHRANMLKRNVTQYGIARSGDYWALVVGRPK
ncbi:CAP domain-containing protein [Salipiger mucosus]|uniref:Allergen V5/Tpx-1 related protein n=1 Tax=Salipiger mucosus DSM 16094 TaxID=1123237 RepID=S9QGC2_9RHOB|nr:CAP domain-containing protein [Salipiger mucosus]EPX78613.1 Allergen V5/Tpx-1 related protein [Salipiger mucosus DSM 16094]